MKFNIFSELSYEVFSPATFIFNVLASRSANQQILEEAVLITPSINFEEFSLHHVDARFIKMEVPQGIFFTITYSAIVEVQHRLINDKDLFHSIPVIQLNNDVLPFLFASRHCQSDKLRKLATKEFGHLPTEYAKACAINEWIFNNIDYISGTTDSGTSAYDTLIQRQGVCKDFAHLGIALCRALDIPARYFTGYACDLNPPDFHACFEAYINGNWIFFDPTKLVPLNGMVKIANSMDAGDAAVASFFGNTNCTYMNIYCNPLDEDFIPILPSAENSQALSYQ